MYYIAQHILLHGQSSSLKIKFYIFAQTDYISYHRSLLTTKLNWDKNRFYSNTIHLSFGCIVWPIYVFIIHASKVNFSDMWIYEMKIWYIKGKCVGTQRENVSDIQCGILKLVTISDLWNTFLYILMYVTNTFTCVPFESRSLHRLHELSTAFYSTFIELQVNFYSKNVRKFFFWRSKFSFVVQPKIDLYACLQ